MTATPVDDDSRLIWQQLHWPRPFDADLATALLRQWAADQRSPHLVLEARATTDGVSHLLGVPAEVGRSVGRTIRALVPGARLTAPSSKRIPVNAAATFHASTRHRALRSADPIAVVRATRAALLHVGIGEQVVVQLVLGSGRVPLAIPTQSQSSTIASWWQIAWLGAGTRLDSEKRSALREKVADHGFACSIRVGVTAETRKRRRSLIMGVLAAIRTSEAAGIRLRLANDRAYRLNSASPPWRWPLRLNVQELAGLTGWPLGDADLPGQPAAHPKLLPPPDHSTTAGRAVARAIAPGVDDVLRLRAEDALHHVHIVGPTGSGKSIMLGRLIEQDIQAGRAVVVVEPKGDLVDDVLARVPAGRQNDVVILDASDDQPVGLNPLTSAGRRPEVVADTILAVFRHLYGDAIGPRSGDILYAATLTLARRRDASLVMLPLLLTNPGFRRSLTADLRDPIALEPFWAAFNSWSDAERTQAISPLMNKLRPFLLRPSLRAVLGQIDPRFSLRQVFTERKILLVPLREGVIGSEAASLLGSLVLAELWQATQERATVAPAHRHPVMLYVDETQNYLNLPTDLGDALAQARGYGTAFHLSHQYLGQLSAGMQRAIRSNARSTIAFQTTQADAVELAKGHPELHPDDFTSLGQYEIYASLFANGRVNPYASGKTLPPSRPTSDANELRRLSRERYGRPLDEIEAAWADIVKGGASDTSRGTGRRPRRPA